MNHAEQINVVAKVDRDLGHELVMVTESLKALSNSVSTICSLLAVMHQTGVNGLSVSRINEAAENLNRGIASTIALATLQTGIEPETAKAESNRVITTDSLR